MKLRMICQVRRAARGCGRTFFRVFAPVFFAGLFCLAASAQTTPNCNAAASTAAVVASTGITEPIGNIVITCQGGASGNQAFAGFYITLNTNITNQLDTNGNPQNIKIETSPGVTTGSPVLGSASSLQIGNVTYTVPAVNTTPVSITISGIRANVASLQGAQSGTVVTASILGIGVNLPTASTPIALGETPLAASVENNGFSCGPVAPASVDFNSFVNAQIPSSAVRVTEAFATAFSPLSTATTGGTRLIVQLSGYLPGTQLWVPSALVGNSGSVGTSGGEFGTAIAGGTYVPNANQLLLSLVTGADQNGVGGTDATSLPTSPTSFTALTQITVAADGSAYAVYEVLDDSPYVQEAVQVPVFIVPPQPCAVGTAVPALGVIEGPISGTLVATHTDPIPRYVSATLGSDCQITGDCNQVYFPVLSLDTTPVSLAGNAQGLTQRASVALLNNGGSLLTYSASINYQSGSGWLSATPSSADVKSSASLVIVADPAALQPGTYSATVVVNAGEAGSGSIPVTFVVGQPGVTIRAIVNAASYQTGIAPGSYVALFGSLLNGQNVGVVFNNQPAQIVYDSAGQVNLIIPSMLAPQSNVSVIATVDGKVSNTYQVTLTANAPGIFNPGILNSDSSVNSSSNPAARGSFVQVYMTGLTVPLTGSLSVTMGNQTGIAPLPGQTYATVVPALNQVNVTIPSSLSFTGNSVPLAVCIAALPGVAPNCSNSVNLYVH